MKIINVLIVGVGGQGTLLASRVLGKLAEMKGYACKLSEVHGMAQRGGSVVTHVRMGDEVFSPIIAEGEADFIIAFEELEGLRARHFLKKDGELLINRQQIMPMPVIIGVKTYPKDIVAKIKKEGINVLDMDALSIANECGNSRAVNTVMLGLLLRRLCVDKESAKEIIKAVVPAKLLEVNLLAVEKGYDYYN
ncbi:MAG: indolepyruvate oxidoreductase subunit beta [Clostridia bacterium]|nr:indolepyruvate oxidoreductase subunit beta [Clostridia bacterium]